MREFVIDLFCGAGGTSAGVHLAKGNSKVVFCVNHDLKAIESHRLNHPSAKHLTEDIRNPEVLFWLKLRVNALRKLYPGCIITVWASLECTNHSKAKGGLSRDGDSRTLADHLEMYLNAINPDFLKIENVVEFRDWGPLRIKEDTRKSKKGSYCNIVLDPKSKTKSIKYKMVPIKEKKGIDYIKWVDSIKSHGYKFDCKNINAADHGAYTSRNRYFATFAKPKIPIVWPEQTHAKKVNKNLGLFESLKPWKKVKDILNLEDQGKSIFDRKKQLCNNTLNVIHSGIIKAIKENEDCFLYKYYGNGHNYNSINTVCGTIPTKDRFGKIQLIFNQYRTGNTSSLERPIGSVTTNPKQKILTFILNPSHGGHCTTVNRPSPTVIARQDKAPLYLIQVLMEKYGIADIKMRMLEIPELLKIQGFPEGYKLVGTQTDKKKFIGNSVEVTTAKAIFEAHENALEEYFEKLQIAA
ncbi:DNA cytosine methyltransferase [Salegentibacter sp. BDJ18]|uniref:DNA cytosine methyltransferase n=1 Tax=Salegentibacter sp. BDJ18 TaxID=2816376 RepID=UPI001AB000EA|nr:DNA cytosine methyltransferase [Salegentibacter sp. BDJ18]MBO2546072.1 DNA cytosine methyltransferase [Salegentibacter sp. BDJ18]